MPVVKFIDSNGGEFEADVAVGSTVMQGAVDNMIEGIIAECGGACSCATCHCYIDSNWWDKVGEPGQLEKELLEMAVEPQDNSRLSCQVEITDEMEGMVVRLPPSQY